MQRGNDESIVIRLVEKVFESARSVIPILGIVCLLSVSVAPLPAELLLRFFIGAFFLILGMGLFSRGVEQSMTPIGNKIGTSLTRTKNLPLILIVSFLLGFAVTVAEPDLQVLARTVPHISNSVLLITVGIGVGLFLSVGMLRILTGTKFRYLLLACYGIIFVLSAFTDSNFLGIAFDAGGVTTGPMTVPFILALGVGVAHIRSDASAESDSFGLVAVCSIGPVLSVLLLGLLQPGTGSAAQVEVVSVGYESTVAIGGAYLRAIPSYFAEMALALAPIALLFFLFQCFALRLSGRNFLKICIGILYTYFGLVLFLTGVNVGFSPLGAALGAVLADGWRKILLIPIAALLGWFIIAAEPAVAVLKRQIEQVSAGAIPAKAIKCSLSVAVSLAMGLSMLRVVFGISLLWFLIPGYAAAFILSFFVPDIYTAIAFDSGGVASGPMTATFMLQLVIGASRALGGNVLQDAFGLVAMVAMLPLLSIQVVGVIYSHHPRAVAETVTYGDLDVVELWEEDV